MYWIAVGDVHESTGMLGSIPGIQGAEAVILTGDLTNRGREPQAERVLDRVLAVNPHVLAQPGNMDHAEVDALLTRRGLNIHCQARLLAPGLVLMGVGCSTPTPFHTPSEISEAELVRLIRETHQQALDLAHRDCPGCAFRLLAVIHTPPLNTSLDRTTNGAHVGSAGVRAFIEEAQPDVLLCGHIHESVGEERLGRTHALNPGLLSEGGFVRLNLADGELRATLERV